MPIAAAKNLFAPDLSPCKVHRVGEPIALTSYGQLANTPEPTTIRSPRPARDLRRRAQCMQRQGPALLEPGELAPQSLDHFVWTWIWISPGHWHPPGHHLAELLGRRQPARDRRAGAAGSPSAPATCAAAARTAGRCAVTPAVAGSQGHSGLPGRAFRQHADRRRGSVAPPRPQTGCVSGRPALRG